MSMLRFVDVYPTAPEAVGQVLPYVFGQAQRVLAIPVLTAAQTTYAGVASAPGQVILQTPILSTDLGPFGFVSAGNPSDMTRFLAVSPGPMSLRMGGELFIGTPIASPPGFVNVIRNGPVPLDHQIGEAIQEVKAYHKYLVCENPGTYRCLDLGNVPFAIWLNGVQKAQDTPPRHQVFIDDQAVIPGRSVVSIRLEAGALTDLSSPFVTPSDVSTLQRYVDQRIQELSGVYGDLAQTLGAGIASHGPQVSPLLGTVEYTLIGLQDVTGSLTGVPQSGIRNPAHVAKLILQEAFDQDPASFDDASWEEAALNAAAYGYHWDFAFYPLSIGDFQRRVFEQSRINIYQDSGRWRAVFRRLGASRMTLGPARRTQWSMRWTPVQDVVTTATVSYGVPPQAQTLVLTAPGVVDANATPGQTLTLELPWVGDGAMARSLGTWQLSLTDHQRRQGTDTHHSEALLLTRLDTVLIDAPILQAYGGALLWKVRGIRIRPDLFLEIDVEEEDPQETTPAEIQLSVARVRRRARLARRLSEEERAQLGAAPLDRRLTGAILQALRAHMPPPFVPDAALLVSLLARDHGLRLRRRDDSDDWLTVSARNRRLKPALLKAAAPLPPTFNAGAVLLAVECSQHARRRRRRLISDEEEGQ